MCPARSPDPQRRSPRTSVTPQYEDAGLFKNEVCQVDVHLAPIMQRTARGDVSITGFVTGGLQISVLFAGRRMVDVDALVKHLNTVRTERLRGAVRVGSKPPDIEAIRLPVQVEGAWRPRFTADESGFETRSYHLVAARWTFLGPQGRVMRGGVAPVR